MNLKNLRLGINIDLNKIDQSSTQEKSTQEILEDMNINDIEQFLRRKKLEKLKKPQK